MPTDDDLSDGYRRLAAAVLLQAVKDATGKGYGADPGDCEDARQWLHSKMAEYIASELGLEHALSRWRKATIGRAQKSTLKRGNNLPGLPTARKPKDSKGFSKKTGATLRQVRATAGNRWRVSAENGRHMQTFAD